MGRGGEKGGIMDGWEKMRDEAQTDDGERLRRRETIGTLPLPPSLSPSLVGPLCSSQSLSHSLPSSRSNFTFTWTLASWSGTEVPRVDTQITSQKVDGDKRSAGGAMMFSKHVTPASAAAPCYLYCLGFSHRLVLKLLFMTVITVDQK